MLAIMPKHKGTDKLQADLRRKIAKITQEAERQAATSKASFFHQKRGRRTDCAYRPAECGQVAASCITHRRSSEIADYPFTTKSPLIGMMQFENVQVQIVDTPPVTIRESRTWLINLSRNTDVIAMGIDLTFSPIAQGETMIQELDNMGIVPEHKDGPALLPGKMSRKMVIIGNKNDIAASKSNYTML